MKLHINIIFAKTSALFMTLVLSAQGFGQSDTPCGAPVLPVNVGCVNTAGTTVGATYQNNAANGGTPGCGAPGAPDVWYSFVAPASGSVEINTTQGSFTDGAMALYNGPCGSPTIIECDDDDGPGLMPYLANTGLTPGATYYIRFWRYGSNTGTFNICVTAAAPPPPAPANDDCAGAYPVTVNPNLLCGSTTAGTVQSATPSIQDPTSCFGTENDDVWFSFVATSTSHSIDLLNVAGSTTDMYHSVWSGTCPTLTLVPGSCSDPNSSTVVGLTIGNTYFIRVYTWSSAAGATSTFDVCVGTPPPPPTNVNCNIPDPICSGSPIVFTAQSNGTAASVVNPGNNYNCLFTSPNPSWYYLEIASGGNLAIDITAGSDVDFAIWGPFPNLATAVANCNSYGVSQDCSYSASAIEQANVNGVVAGEVYVLLVTNFANTVQTITLTDAGTNTATTDCTIVPLSVELTDFNGVNVDNEIALTWTTASEQNNSHFVVERSTDASIWTAIAVENGAGTTTSTQHYTSVDRNPSNGDNYYRLKQFDFDGKMTISDIISVSSSTVNKVIVYPNPANDRVSVISNHEIIAISIVDIRGTVVYSENFDKVNSTSIELSDLNGGLYYLQTETTSGKTTERIVVQH